MKHKDGCTAVCPYFVARTGYKGQHFISCQLGDSIFGCGRNAISTTAISAAQAGAMYAKRPKRSGRDKHERDYQQQRHSACGHPGGQRGGRCHAGAHRDGHPHGSAERGAGLSNHRQLPERSEGTENRAAWAMGGLGAVQHGTEPAASAAADEGSAGNSGRAARWPPCR